MSKEIPTPYVWTFQPQTGQAAGASQDYSTRMNWLSAGPSMINKVNMIRDNRNQILLRQSAITETPRLVTNPPAWPAPMLIQPQSTPMTLELPRNEHLELLMANSGMQLAGGGSRCGHFSQWIKPAHLRGLGIQLNGDTPSASFLRPDGVFQLGGGGRSSFNPVDTFLTLQTSSSQQRSGGLGSAQFVREFVPSVYFNPFSGPPDTYPEAFISNYNVITDSVSGYD